MPFEPKQRGRNVDKALKAVKAAYDRMRAAERARADAKRQRADAIDYALAEGASLREIARLMEVTPERVRQMRDV